MNVGFCRRVFLARICLFPRKVTLSCERCIETQTSSQSSEGNSKPRKNNIQRPLNWKRFFKFLAFSGVAIGGSVLYLENQKEKERIRKRDEAMLKTGIGGKFELTDPSGRKVCSDELLGNWLLIYFGFTHCPDICPDEMQKMVETVNLLEKDDKKVIPVFISVDPDRDTPSVVGKYAKEFSPKIIALTGNKEQIQETAKNFRVYHSQGPKDSFNDYIVDHTIITYLINPKGIFVDYYGNRKNAQQMRVSILNHMKNYDMLQNKSWWNIS